MNLNEWRDEIHRIAKEKGWWDKPRNALEIHALIVSEIGEAFQAVAQQKGIALSLETPGDVSVMGDETQLRQLFSNLIDNAVKYTPSGGAINIAVAADNEQVTVTVQDTGIGISKEDIPRIFDRFYRVDKSRSRENGGSGLGLSICYWIVKAHQGTIEVGSSPGNGTTIFVTLPVTFSQ